MNKTKNLKGDVSPLTSIDLLYRIKQVIRALLFKISWQWSWYFPNKKIPVFAPVIRRLQKWANKV